MYKTLDELDVEESRIIDKVAALEGTIEDKAEKINQSGIFFEYKRVHKAYIELIKHGTESQKREALKRALFIQWYGISEPSIYTGIDYETVEFANEGLSWEDITFVFSELNSLICKNELDEEFIAMLTFYATWNFIFQYKDFQKFENLQNFVNQNCQSNGNHIQKVRSFNLEHRGQMGKYWLSLNLSSI